MVYLAEMWRGGRATSPFERVVRMDWIEGGLLLTGVIMGQLSALLPGLRDLRWPSSFERSHVDLEIRPHA